MSYAGAWERGERDEKQIGRRDAIMRAAWGRAYPATTVSQPVPARTNLAYREGFAAIDRGQNHNENPYEFSAKTDRTDWFVGYYDAMTARDLAHIVDRRGPFEQGLSRAPNTSREN